ncbi:MAG TPA: GTP-binding protein, partial [Candidatus Acetothermia bacterium]|nr:GTP-binding protein [Candidatus Acetothermia bacterium]
MSLKVKNIAIISHVDHGKTTLVDCLLRFSGTLRDTSDRLLDSNDLEKEKGMTILSKVASVSYKDYKINIVDTPGHADFGGEVERIMNMVDGVFLLVDAAEGPMPQTKFLLSKVLEYGFRPIVVINKIDKRDAMPDIVAGQVFDLFYNLGANAKQLDFPLLYASARHGYAIEELSDERKDFAPFFEAALKYISEPKGSNDNPLQV